MTSKTRWFYGGVGILTAGTLILELALTRIFSVIMFYHFAFLAISLALFGIGLSGIYVYLRPGLLEEKVLGKTLMIYGLLAGVTAFLCIPPILQQATHLGFRSPTLSTLGIIYLCASAPFFFSGVCLTILIEHFRKDMGRLYFYDLLGAGIGCLALTPLLMSFGGIHSVFFAGLLFVISTFFFQRGASPDQAPQTAVVSVALLLSCGFFVWSLVAPFKAIQIPSLKETLENRVVFTAWNSFSRVTVEKLTDRPYWWIKMDSSAATAMYQKSYTQDVEGKILSAPSRRLGNLIYFLDIPGKALIIGPGGGTEVAVAVAKGRKEVIGVELNPIIVDVVKERFRDFNGGIYNHPKVTIHKAEGRNFIRSSKAKFATIQATLVDTWAATAAGAFSLSENTLYTREAFREYFEHLEDHGILAMQRWKIQPPREFLRLLVLGRTALIDQKIPHEEHYKYFFAASVGMKGRPHYCSMLLKKTPFTAQEVAILERESAKAGLTIEHTPSRRLPTYHAGFLHRRDWQHFVKHYAFDITPPSDDRPFFFYTSRPADSLKFFQHRQVHMSNQGLLILVLALGMVSVLLLLFFVLPLLLFRRDVLKTQRLLKIRYLLYFFCLGIAFIVIEIALMQKFILFLGHPMYALIVVLFTLLVASGIGSFSIRDIPEGQASKSIFERILFLCGLVIVYHLSLETLFSWLAAIPLTARILLSVICLAPLGFFMGSLLPLGIQGANEPLRPLIPWAWGINGAASVFGSILAILLALHLGFSFALFIGIAVYFLGFVSLRGAFVQSDAK